MATRLNQLLKLGLLRHKIGLQKENVSATAVSTARRAMKPQALGKKITIAQPQSVLPNDNLHALKPTGHGGVVFREIKCLRLSVWKRATAHAWAIRVRHPPFLGSYERSWLVNKHQKRLAGVLVQPEELAPNSMAPWISEHEECCVCGGPMVIATDMWWETNTHLSPYFGQIWHLVHTFDGWAHCRIEIGLEPSPW